MYTNLLAGGTTLAIQSKLPKLYRTISLRVSETDNTFHKLNRSVAILPIVLLDRFTARPNRKVNLYLTLLLVKLIQLIQFNLSSQRNALQTD